jgi:hypothetical protein
MAYLHADESDSSKLAGHNIIKATDEGLLSSVQVAAATSVTDLQNDVNAAVVHADTEDEKKVVNDGLELAEGLGDLDDTKVQAAATVQDLVDDTQADGDGYRGPTVLD